MDLLLGRVTQQAMNYAIRSGISITSAYAIRQCSRLLQNVHGDEHEELSDLQTRLESKIRIISPAIDMIELIAARGNSSLESAVSLTKALRWDIQCLGLRLANAANAEEHSRRGGAKTKTGAEHEAERKLIVREIRKLLNRIEDAVPLINLAITTSGARLSTSLPSTISPSRLLQASTFLTAGDTQYAMQTSQACQIGPTFTLSLYMLFRGHATRPREQDGTVKETTWQEVVHKARVKLCRVPIEKAYHLPSARSEAGEEPADGARDAATDDPSRTSAMLAGEGRSDEFAYQILMIEDLDDDRVHSLDDDEPEPAEFDDVARAGIREVIPIHEISKIFYADTGKILSIGSEGEMKNPVLLLKRDVNALPPRRMMERVHGEQEWYDDSVDPERSDESEPDEDQPEVDAQITREERSSSLPVEEEAAPARADPWRLKSNLDPEWMAFEVYVEQQEPDSEDEPLSDTDSKPTSRASRPSREGSLDPNMTSAFSALNIASSNTPSPSPPASNGQMVQMPFISGQPSAPAATFNNAGPIRTSLSLLETLIRLTALQQFQQTSHLSITDELLNFFLSESSTTGAGNDGDERRRKRWEARQRLGFDPYDDSPMRRRERGAYTYEEGGYVEAEDGGEGEGDFIDDADVLPSSPRLAHERIALRSHHTSSPPKAQDSQPNQSLVSLHLHASTSHL
ncbi:MAG: hypothetical protein M1838_002267 [Thelocarpon superellum]|nr:MAG: hypothetical protein M1838_002267 [Thelocarpon superellum]